MNDNKKKETRKSILAKALKLQGMPKDLYTGTQEPAFEELFESQVKGQGSAAKKKFRLKKQQQPESYEQDQL